MQEPELTPYQAGRLVQSVEDMQKDLHKLTLSLDKLEATLGTRIAPLEAFRFKLLGIVIILPTAISSIGVAVAIFGT